MHPIQQGFSGHVPMLFKTKFPKARILEQNGWCNVLESVKSNTVKEVKEETGLDARAVRLIAVQDRNKHNLPAYAYGICKIFVLCDVIGGAFTENSETTEIKYFSYDEIPNNLAGEKTNKKQIEMCFRAAADKNWQVQFD